MVRKRKVAAARAAAPSAVQLQQQKQKRPAPPPYGKRKGWRPQVQEDFGDGGAYPEIHVAQFPLGCGRDASQQSNAVAMRFDSQGQVDYLTTARSGNVQSTARALVPVAERERVDLARPDEEEEQQMEVKTRAALEEAMGLRKAGQAEEEAARQQGSLVRYTPVGRPGEKVHTRVIRMVEVQEDPLEPSKFQHKRAPAGPPSPPVPVLHSPTRALTKEERQEWTIPPCVSNWKNPKGYTVPLDKRLAAEGVADEQVVNDRFASFAESLYLAEQNAREDVARRAEIRREAMLAEQEATQLQLQEEARRTREERMRIQQAAQQEDAQGWRERESMREERRQGRERERRQGKRAHGDRDVSERIALGDAMPRSRESMYDQRLFNQAAETRRADGGADDEYDIYDKPLFDKGSAHALQRRTNAEDSYGSQADMDRLLDTSRFRASNAFKGADEEGAAAPRDGPVQFKRAAPEADSAAPDDLLAGLDDFLATNKKRKPDE